MKNLLGVSFLNSCVGDYLAPDTSGAITDALSLIAPSGNSDTITYSSLRVATQDAARRTFMTQYSK